MPFCADCDRFYNPNTLTAEGDCPDGHHVADPTTSPAPPAETVPWHFWLMLVLVVAYLGWRLLQFIGGLF